MLLSAATGEGPVVIVGVWHNAQPIWLKILAPFCVEAVGGAGCGWSRKRMNIENLTMSLAASVPLRSTLVKSSGVGLKPQPGVSSRSLGKFSLVTPISTL